MFNFLQKSLISGLVFAEKKELVGSKCKPWPGDNKTSAMSGGGGGVGLSSDKTNKYRFNLLLCRDGDGQIRYFTNLAVAVLLTR